MPQPAPPMDVGSGVEADWAMAGANMVMPVRQAIARIDFAASMAGVLIAEWMLMIDSNS